MIVSRCSEYQMIEPLDESELAAWRPSASEALQFVRVDEREVWLFHRGAFLGVAGRLLNPDRLVWQASSREGDVCIAPLGSPLDCARRLLERGIGNH